MRPKAGGAGPKLAGLLGRPADGARWRGSVMYRPCLSGYCLAKALGIMSMRATNPFPPIPTEPVA